MAGWEKVNHKACLLLLASRADCSGLVLQVHRTSFTWLTAGSDGTLQQGIVIGIRDQQVVNNCLVHPLHPGKP